MLADFYFSIKAWTLATFAPYGFSGLFILAFIESSFFPIPPDILLIILALASPEQAYFLALIATIGSVLGGILGYYIGFAGEKLILEKLFVKKKLRKIHNLFNKYESAAVFIGGFTPLPYKLFTIAAGVFYLDFKKFIIASILSRGLRFFLIAFLISFFHEGIETFILEYVNVLSIIFGVLIIGYFIFKKWRRK